MSRHCYGALPLHCIAHIHLIAVQEIKYLVMQLGITNGIAARIALELVDGAVEPL